MKLSKEHRESLTEDLEKAIERKAEIEKHMEYAKENNKDLIPLYEIDDFLNDKKIDLIKQALIDNEIDY